MNTITARRRGRSRQGWARFAGMVALFGAAVLAWAIDDAPEVSERAVEARADSASVPVAVGQFERCHRGGGWNCVVDGDTFWIGGEKIRIADIDTPETHLARCSREAELGEAATRRLQALLNGGAIELVAERRDADRYGRKLRLVRVDGRGVGETLIAEGLARPYQGGYRAGWCD